MIWHLNGKYLIHYENACVIQPWIHHIFDICYDKEHPWTAMRVMQHIYFTYDRDIRAPDSKIIFIFNSYELFEPFWHHRRRLNFSSLMDLIPDDLDRNHINIWLSAIWPFLLLLFKVWQSFPEEVVDTRTQCTSTITKDLGKFIYWLANKTHFEKVLKNIFLESCLERLSWSIWLQ